MNQLSWSRILQNAENGEAAEAGAAIIHLQDRAPHWRQGRGKAGSNAGEIPHLAADFRYTPGRMSQKRQRHNPSRSIRQDTVLAAKNHVFHDDRQPAGQRQALSGKHLLPATISNSPRSQEGSGAKNLLAIFLSVAVIGFAFHQINTRWLEANRIVPAQPDTVDASATLAMLVTSTTSPTEARDEPKAKFEGNRLDMGASVPRERQALRPAARSKNARHGKKAAANSLTAAASEQASASPSLEAEQMMIRRGYEMMQAGHIEGARLIFEHLATQNSALGAFALAQTYDSQFLSSQNIPGAAPDENLSAKWYQVAAGLTNAAANFAAR